MTAYSSSHDLAQAAENGSVDTAIPDSGHGTTAEKSVPPTSTQAESGVPLATQGAGEASNSAPPRASPPAEESLDPVPSVILPIEKEIVATGVARLNWYMRLSPKHYLFLEGSAGDIARKTMHEDAQRSSRSRRIWELIFDQGDTMRREDLLEYDIFSQDTWKTLYDCVTKPFNLGGVEMSPREMMRPTNEETRENLKRWEKKQGEIEEEWLRVSEELDKEFERQMAAGLHPSLKLVGLPSRVEDSENETNTSASTSEQAAFDSDMLAKTEIIRVCMWIVWHYADDVYEKATYLLRRSVQKHPEGPRIWKREFVFTGPESAKKRFSKLLDYTFILAPRTFSKLYQLLTEEFPELKEVQGKTPCETYRNMFKWYQEFDTTGKRPFGPGEQLQWDMRIDADVTNESARNGDGKEEGEKEPDKDQNENGKSETNDEEKEGESPPVKQLADMNISDE